MGLYILFVILIVIAAVLMIGIVLIQESKGGGLASNFSSSNQIMGVRKTTDFIEKATWGLAAAMVVFSVVCAYVAPSTQAEQSAIERSADDNATNASNVPNFGTAAPKQDAKAPAKADAKAPAAPAEKPAAPKGPAK